MRGGYDFSDDNVSRADMRAPDWNTATMAITDRDRRLLWARAHNRCAYCRLVLTRDPSTAGGDVVVADEAHIIARAPDGPRGRDGDRADIDGYGNLILLCKNDHKIIDDLPRKYPVERLLQMKREHEV